MEINFDLFEFAPCELIFENKYYINLCVCFIKVSSQPHEKVQKEN